MAKRKAGVSLQNYYNFLQELNEQIQNAGQGNRTEVTVSKLKARHGINSAATKVIKDIGWLRDIGGSRYFWDGPRIIEPRHAQRLIDACNAVGRLKKDSLIRLRLEGRIKAFKNLRNDLDRDIAELEKLL